MYTSLSLRQTPYGQHWYKLHTIIVQNPNLEHKVTVYKDKQCLKITIGNICVEVELCLHSSRLGGGITIQRELTGK
jgi:hypothetical protein